MPTPTFGQLDGNASLERIRDFVYQLQETLQWLMRNLDSKNIRAHSITADRMNVTELSAIAADIGTITAGVIRGIQIYGTYIATEEGTYPRIELSSSGNLLAAYLNANDYIAIDPDLTGDPTLAIYEGGVLKGFLSAIAGNTTLYGQSSLLNIISNLDIVISAGAAYLVKFDSWSKMYNEASGQNLQQALNAKQNTISGATASFTTADGKTVTVSNGIITSVV